jgi:hypothetical protein
MDEILSSIRQIIADDDAAVAPKMPAPVAPPVQSAPAAAPRPFHSLSTPAAAIPATVAPVTPRTAIAETPVMEPSPAPLSPEPLALSPEQILPGDDDDEPVTALSFEDILASDDRADEPMSMVDEGQLVDPEDIAFEEDSEPEPQAVSGFSVSVEPSVAAPRPMALKAPPAQKPLPVQPTPRPAPSVAQAAPMPDPTLSADVAEQLLEPTTKSAVKHAFSRLSGLSMVGSGVTVEDMMREMLRPMLKEWLDENLPSIVEGMVEKEIARISRGVE